MEVGFPQEGVTYFSIFTPATHLLVCRLISEHFVEVCSKLPDISPILNMGKGLLQDGVTISTFFIVVLIVYLVH